MNLWTSGLPLAECLLWGWLLASVVFLSASWGLTLLLQHKSPALKSLIWVAGFTLTFLCGASMQLPGLIRLPVLPAASIKTPPLHSPTIAPVEIPTKAAAAFSLSTPARPIVHPAINPKRSAAISLWKDARLVAAGNVTIPANQPIPRVGEVAEVRYLYAMPDSGSLFQPVFLGVRDDIAAVECQSSQLKFKAA